MLEEYLFQLTKESLFVGPFEDSLENNVQDCDWDSVYEEMKAQSIDALAQKWLMQHEIPDETLRNKWIQSSMFAQKKWIKLMYSQDQLLKLLDQHEIPCVIIKGAAAAMAYPYPSLRKAGDIDFLVSRADFDKAVHLLENYGYSLEDYPTSHHVCFKKNGISFELHHHLGIIRKKNEELIKLFEDGITHREYKQIESFSFPVLPAQLNGLVLMFHIDQHLRTGLGLRHICDWMMYLHQNDNLEELLPYFRRWGLEKLAITVTILCREYFGLRVKGLEEISDPEEYPYEELKQYLLEKGDFGRKSGLAGRQAAAFLHIPTPIHFIKRLQDGGMCRWKLARNYRVLQPFAWIYQIGFLTHKLIAGQYTVKELLQQHKIGAEQRTLIYKLGLDVDSKI